MMEKLNAKSYHSSVYILYNHNVRNVPTRERPCLPIVSASVAYLKYTPALTVIQAGILRNVTPGV
jgi:uncharacterized membrane protein YGL010W